MKKGISFFLSVVLLLTLLPGSAYAAESGMGNFQRNGSYYTGLFTDVPADAWYADGVAAAYELGLMVGSGQKTFSPNGTVTLAEAVAMAARIHSRYGSADPQPLREWNRVLRARLTLVSGLCGLRREQRSLVCRRVLRLHRSRHWAPLRAIQSIPFSIVRLSLRGRPRFPVSSGGRRSLTRSHCSFVNSYRFMPLVLHICVYCATFIFQTSPSNIILLSVEYGRWRKTADLFHTSGIQEPLMPGKRTSQIMRCMFASGDFFGMSVVIPKHGSEIRMCTVFN